MNMQITTVNDDALHPAFGIDPGSHLVAARGILAAPAHHEDAEVRWACDIVTAHAEDEDERRWAREYRGLVGEAR